MRIAVTGSIATDYLMVFPGRFTEQIVNDQLDRLSLSFLVDNLQVRRGGTAGNIAFGLGCLGLRPLIVGAVGPDFEDYRSWLERHGVDTESVHVSDTYHTARFLCTTDQANNQIASFYAGAMAEARNIELKPVADRVGGLDLVVIGANDPEGMRRHTEECRERRYPFAADFSQQIARMSGDDLRELVSGAAYLFTNEYEAGLLLEKTGWTASDVLGQVRWWVTTLGADGARMDSADGRSLAVPAVPAKREVDPTGSGDAFRAGFFAGLSWGVSDERAMQVGCALATTALEAMGPQDYRVEPGSLVQRLADTYGEDAGEEARRHLVAT